jgi:hypothetical protein
LPTYTIRIGNALFPILAANNDPFGITGPPGNAGPLSPTPYCAILLGINSRAK